MSELRLYNTESKQKESVPRSEDGTTRIYACGPTVYNFAHIGNLRTYVFEDLLKRTLRYFGHPVFHVMNITDVDDKTIKGAIEQGTTLESFTKPYRGAFFEDLKTLNIEPADRYPSAIEHIPDMIAMIESLLQQGIAYKGEDGSVYYSVAKFPSYGRLSHLKLDELKANAGGRLDDEYDKDAVSDFVLWKGYDESRDGDLYWESPFGKGRPGWHIECSAMAIKHCGETVDIHMGGIDNMFPHHENEIAQSEGCTHKRFAKLWMHAEHLIVNGKKMSKSLGNFFTLRDLLDKGYTGAEIRFLLLQTHYKTQLNFTEEGLVASRNALRRIRDCLDRVARAEPSDTNTSFDGIEAAFQKALADDLNISEALSAVFDLVKRVNAAIDAHTLSAENISELHALFSRFETVLGCLPLDQQEAVIPEDVQQALVKRTEARSAKDWGLADEMRDFIHAAGYEVEDSPTGPVLKKR